MQLDSLCVEVEQGEGFQNPLCLARYGPDVSSFLASL